MRKYNNKIFLFKNIGTYYTDLTCQNVFTNDNTTVYTYKFNINDKTIIITSLTDKLKTLVYPDMII